MEKDFVWVDESYDHNCIHGQGFYVLCAIKLKATPSQRHFTYSSRGNPKGEIHSHIHTSCENIKKMIKKINKHNKSKRKLRVTELHESVLLSSQKTKRIKTLFLKELFQSKPNMKFEIYYVYEIYEENTIINNKELYQKMARELLNSFSIPKGSNIVMDICLDKFSSSKDHDEIINFLRRECNISESDAIKFDDSQSNYGLQAVDNVVGTIRRYLNRQEDDAENYEIIKGHIVSSIDVNCRIKRVNP